MAKYYVQSGNLRLALDAGTAGDAAMRAVQRCQDRQAEIFREPAEDRIRDIEILDWQVDRKIRVSETGFDGDGDILRQHHWQFTGDSLLTRAADGYRWTKLDRASSHAAISCSVSPCAAAHQLAKGIHGHDCMQDDVDLLENVPPETGHGVRRRKAGRTLKTFVRSRMSGVVTGCMSNSLVAIR